MTIYPNVGALWLYRNAIIVVAAPVDLKLFKAIAAPMSISTIITDFTDADFSGYAPAVVANLLAPYLDPVGGVSAQTGTQQFTFDGADVTPTINTIYGWYMANGGDLIACGTFDAPVSMARDGDAIPLNAVLNMFRS